MKVVPFESLGMVSYLPFIVTVTVSVAVCEIFSVKEWRDHDNQVRGRSRSLKMAPFDKPYATFYWSAIVNIALYLVLLVTYWCRGLGQPLVNGLSPSTDQRSGTAFQRLCGRRSYHCSRFGET